MDKGGRPRAASRLRWRERGTELKKLLGFVSMDSGLSLRERRNDGRRDHTSLHASFRGSRVAAEPGIHNHGSRMAYYVYLLASKKHGTLYLGVTNDLIRRVYEHRTKAAPGFTSRYDIGKLVWFEIYDNAITAVAREKELKKWRRDWKIRLIEENNPNWDDLYPGICG